MPRKRIALVLPEVDRVRWQYAADVRGVAIERFVRDAVEAAIAAPVMRPSGVTCGCTIDRLCDSHVEDGFAQLRGVAANRGEHWADDLATQRRAAWTPWPVDSERVRVAAIVKVEDLTRDERLRERLAVEVVAWAARRWNERQELRGQRP